MSRGSEHKWGIPAEKRFCALPSCGEKLTLKMHVWVEFIPEVRAWHVDCYLRARKSGLLEEAA